MYHSQILKFWPLCSFVPYQLWTPFLHLEITWTYSLLLANILQESCFTFILHYVPAQVVYIAYQLQGDRQGVQQLTLILPIHMP